MRRTHRLPARFIRWISLSVCFALLLTSSAMLPPFVRGKASVLATQEQGNQAPENGRARKVKAEPPQTGPPSGTLPDLDEVKGRHEPQPEAPVPIPSTMRSKRKPLESRNGRKVGDPLPRVKVGSVGKANTSDLVAYAGTRLLQASRYSTTNSSLPNNLLAWNRDASILDLFSAPAVYLFDSGALKFLRYASLQSYQAISDSPFLVSLASPRHPANESAFNLPPAPMPYGNGYTYSRSITIYHAKIPNTDQSNFPVLVSGTYSYLATVANGGNVQNSNGYDVIFTSDSGCATKLNHEVETYNATTGAVNYWVKVPTVSHTSDTTIYMCYGNSIITTDQSNKTAVWDANYKGVWHLGNGTTLSVADSTNHLNGTNHSAAAVSGKVDGGAGFDGSSQYISMPSMSLTSLITIEFWMARTGTLDVRATPISFGRDGVDGFDAEATSTTHKFTKSGVVRVDSGIAVSGVGVWDHIVWTVDSDLKPRLYVNGSLVFTSTDTQAINATTHGAYLGATEDTAGAIFRYALIRLDEVRLSNTVRSANWIATEYNNQNSPSTFYTISASSSNQPPVANAGGPYSGIVGQNVPFNGGSSYDPDGSISSYSWTFGDGGTGSGVAPTHAYGSAGTYNVTLTVTDNLGAQTSASTTISVTTSSSDQFVQNFLQWGLARAPQGDEAPYWSDMMRAAYPQGQTSMLIAMREFGMTVFESAEYASRNRSDHDYVYDLYKTYLMREPDQAGWNFWTGQVPHAGRESVRHAFDECGEFSTIISTLTASGSPSSAVASLATARVNPFNQTGNQLQARDCEWSLPLLSLPGRAGLDLGLGLSYSSLVWTRSGPYVYFDQDNGSPSPGFRLGFATIQGPYFDAQVGRNVYLLVTSSGQRVELRQVGTSSTYEAGDSSYLQLIVSGNSLLLRTIDGTQIGFTRFENDWHTTTIEDRNGNLINVNYDWRGDITNITDTLSRMVTFNYDSNANLSTITQSWLVNGIAQPHTWASFGWTTVTMQPNFGGEVVGTHSGEVIPVLAQVGLSDGSRHTFEYTGAGQVNLIRRYTSDNVQRSYLAYDYAPASDYIPRLTQTRVSADNWTNLNGVPAEVVTQYSDPGDGSHVMTAPDGTVYKEFYAGSSPVWQGGLITQSEVWSGGVRQKWTTTAWTQDNTSVSYQTNPRVTETNIYDAAGNHNRGTVSYTSFTLASGVNCSLPSDAYQYAADATMVLRRSHTDYNLSSTYLDRRIIGLAASQTLFDGANNLMARTDFLYDETGSVQNQGATTQHDDTNYGSGFVAGRANVSSVRRYDVINSGQSKVSSVQYNTAGAVVTAIDPAGHQSSISYTDSFSDSINRNTFAYPTTITDADGYQSLAQYNYDFGAKTRVQGPPPAGQTQGVIQIFAYDSSARLQQVTTTNNGAYTRYVYGPNYVVNYSTVNNVADDAYAIQMFDGVGRVIGAARNHPGSAGGYSAVSTQYDAMGRAMKQSNPTEVNSSWTPAGDDAAGWIFTQSTYDWKGRPLVTTNTDGTQKYASYSACGCAGSEVVTLTDEVGRQQKVYSDVLGGVAKTEILQTVSNITSVYSTTANTYNARDQVKLVRQFQGAAPGDPNDLSCPSGACQQTTMSYDGYGRLLTKHAPEQQVDPNNSSSTDHTTWSYNADDTITSVTDARGASATYSYNNNRRLVTGISYSAPYGITPTSNVSFGYDAAGNRSSMTDGLGSKSYNYNQLSQLMSEARTFTNVGTFTLSYDYNLAGQLKKITDATNTTINYGYDSAGRLNGVTGSDNLVGGVSNYASGFQYRAWGGLKQISAGATHTASFGYNSRLQANHFDISGGVVNQNYDYFNDGRINFVHNTTDNNFDRAYTYDHAGRLTAAASGGEARHDLGAVPMYETFAYNAWDNTTTRVNESWLNDYYDSGSYANNRRTGWGYDADGRIASIDTRTYSYDAAGQNIFLNGQRWTPGGYIPTSTTSDFDGDGNRIRETSDGIGSMTTTYYLRSSVLRGAIVEELNSSGQKQLGYVYTPAGSLLARQAPGNDYVSVKQISPIGSSQYEFSFSNTMTESVSRREFDPVGANVPLNNHSSLGHGGGPGDIPGGGGGAYDSRFSALESPAAGCMVDGVYTPCDWIGRMLSSGSLAQAITSEGKTTRLDLQDFGLGIYGVWHQGRPGRSGNSSNEIDDSGDHPIIRTNNRGSDTAGYWEFLNIGFALPQNYAAHDVWLQTPRPHPDVEGLLQNPDCEKFLNGLLNEISKFGEPYSRDFRKVDAAAEPYFRYHSYPPDSSVVGGTPGRIIGDPYLEIFMDAGKARPGSWFALEYIAIHETIHAAATSGTGYTHEQMAIAAYNVAPEAVLKSLKNTNTPGPPDLSGAPHADQHNSELFNQILWRACPPRR